MKMCEISLVIRKMQNKITVTHHFTTTRMAKVKKINTTNVSEKVEPMGRLYIVSEKNGTVTLENCLEFSYQVKHTFTTTM